MYRRAQVQVNYVDETAIRDCYQIWLKTVPNNDISNYYQENIKKLDAQIKVVLQGKK